MEMNQDNLVLRSKQAYKRRWLYILCLLSGVLMAGFCLLFIVAIWLSPKSDLRTAVVFSIWLGLTAAFMLLVPFTMLNRALTGYRLTSNGLIECTIGRRRTMPWRDVVDYAVEAGGAGQPLSHIVFHLVDGKTKKLPLDMFPELKLQPLLSTYVPLIAEHGLDRARSVTNTSDELRKCTRKAMVSNLIGIFFCLALAVLFMWASAIKVLEHFEYRRIIKNPVQVTATVVELHIDEKNSSLTLEFTANNGQVIRSTRSIMYSRAKTLMIGSKVLAQHLRGSPDQVRLNKGDLDSREWMYLFISIPLGWLFIISAAKLIWSVIAPKSALASWSIQNDSGNSYIRYTPTMLETNVALFPEQHENTAVVFLRLNDKGPKAEYTDRKTAFSPNSYDLKKSGIECEDLIGGFLYMGPEALSRFISRLGEIAKTRAEYIMLDLPDTDATRSWILRNDLNDKDRTNVIMSDAAQFSCRNHTIGPVNKDNLTPALDQFINQLIKSICDGQNSVGLLDAHISEILGLSSHNLDARIMLSLQTDRLRVYINQREAKRALVAEYSLGQWRRIPDTAVPLAMRNFKWFKRILMLPYGPWLAIPLLAFGVHWAIELPCLLYRKSEIKKARADLDSTTPHA